MLDRDLTGGRGAWMPITNEASDYATWRPATVGLLRLDLCLTHTASIPIRLSILKLSDRTMAGRDGGGAALPWCLLAFPAKGMSGEVAYLGKNLRKQVIKEE